MFKNVAGQKVRVFAFDATTNLPKMGDAANLTAYVSKDYGAVTVLADTTATEEESTNAKGFYLFDLAQAETNADYLGFSGKSSTANIVVIAVPGVVYTVPPNFATASIDASGRVLLQPSQPGVTIPTVTTLTNLPAIPANWITAAGIAAGALNGKGDWLTATGYNSTPPWYTAPANPTDYARNNVAPSWYTSPDNANITYLRNYADADRVIDVGVSPWAEVLFLRGTGTELVRKKLRDVSGVGVLSDQTVIGSAKDA